MAHWFVDRENLLLFGLGECQSFSKWIKKWSKFDEKLSQWREPLAPYETYAALY